MGMDNFWDQPAGGDCSGCAACCWRGGWLRLNPICCPLWVCEWREASAGIFSRLEQQEAEEEEEEEEKSE